MEKAKLKLKWFWRDGFHPKGDPEKIGRELNRLAEKHGLKYDALTTRTIVEGARSARDYPNLHAAFEWDDEVAAEKYRLRQASDLCRSLGYQIIDSGEHVVCIGRVSTVNEEGERQFVPTPIAARNEDLRKQILEDCVRGIESWRARYEQLRQADKRPDVRAAFKSIDRGIARLKQITDQEGNEVAATA